MSSKRKTRRPEGLAGEYYCGLGIVLPGSVVFLFQAVQFFIEKSAQPARGGRREVLAEPVLDSA